MKNIKYISSELIGALAGTFTLSVLVHGDSYGYAIVQKIKELSIKPIFWKTAGIYPILKKYEAREYIKSYWKMEEGQRPRRYYKITKKGEEALQAGKEDIESVDHIYEHLWAPPGNIT